MSDTAPRSLMRSGLVVSVTTLISRVAGLIRDLVVAITFGAGPLTDAFFVAFRIPNLFRRLFGEGAVSHAFVPVLTEVDERGDPRESQDLVAHVMGTLGAVLLAVAAVGAIAAPVLVWVFAPGFVDDAGRFDPAVAMLRLCFPYVFFISLVAAAGGVMQSRGRFAVPAATPILLNLCIIASSIWIAPNLEQPIYALAIGVLIAGVVQLSFQLPTLAKLGVLARPRWGWRHAGTRRVMALLLPFVLSSGVYQINALVSSVVASLLVASSVSWLYYADRLLEFPHALVGVALGTVILPQLARLHVRENTAAFAGTVGWAVHVGLLIGLPATLGLAMLAEPLIATLFQYGAFDAQDRHMAARALQVLAFALPALIIIKVLTPAFSSREDTRTPVRIAVWCMGVNMVGCVVFGLGLHGLGYDAAHVGLSVATVISTFLQAALLLMALRKVLSWQFTAGAVWRTMRPLCALGAMALLLHGFTPAMDWWSDADVWQRVMQLGGIIVAACVIYVSVLALLGMRPADLRSVE